MVTFPELLTFETQIVELLDAMNKQGDNLDPETINHYARLIGNYSQKINETLKQYHTITKRAEKLQSKARLKYAYDFLQILLELLKCVEMTNRLNQSLHEVLCELYNKQDDLLETQYFIAAKRELDVFNNPQLRTALEQDLAKKYFEKFH